MAVVVIGYVVAIDAINDVVSHETIKTVAMRDAVLNRQTDGLLVRVKAVARTIQDLDAGNVDVGILLGAAGTHAGVEPVNLAGRLVTVAVNGQVQQASIGGDLVVGGAHDTGDVTGPAIGHLKDGLAYARTLKDSAGEQFDRSIALVPCA